MITIRHMSASGTPVEGVARGDWWMHDHMDRFCQSYGRARQAERTALAAEGRMARREAPQVDARRIERLEADRRRTGSVLEGQSAAYGSRICDSEWKAQPEAKLEHIAARILARHPRSQVDACRAPE